MINHAFVWQEDIRAMNPECGECDAAYSEHPNIEGVTHEDEILDSDELTSDITAHYADTYGDV